MDNLTDIISLLSLAILAVLPVIAGLMLAIRWLDQIEERERARKEPDWMENSRKNSYE